MSERNYDIGDLRAQYQRDRRREPADEPLTGAALQAWKRDLDRRERSILAREEQLAERERLVRAQGELNAGLIEQAQRVRRRAEQGAAANRRREAAVGPWRAVLVVWTVTLVVATAWVLEVCAGALR